MQRNGWKWFITSFIFFAGRSLAISLTEKSSDWDDQRLKIAFFFMSRCDDNIILNKIKYTDQLKSLAWGRALIPVTPAAHGFVAAIQTLVFMFTTK